MIYLFFLACSSSQDSGETEKSENTQNIDTITVEDYRPDIEFSTAKECGECHPTHYEEWRQSMHAYAAHSPVFDAMAQKAFRDTSGEVGDFCTSCHSPIGAIQGETEPPLPPQDQRYLRTLFLVRVCHSAVTHGYPVGNLSLGFTPTEERYGPYGSQETEGHTSRYSELHQSAEVLWFLSSVCLIFPGLRIEEAYTEYAQSPAQEQGMPVKIVIWVLYQVKPSGRDKGPIAVVDGYVYPDRDLISSVYWADYSLLDTFPYPNDLSASAEAQEDV